MGFSAGVLVVNLGTPDEPTPPAVRRFLGEFLSDRRVVDLPRLPWLALLHGLVLPLRAPKSARAYASIWTPAGSPLLTGSQAIVRALERELAARLRDPPRVVLGMTYGEPSIAGALARLREDGVRRLVTLPLYPQYSRTTTAAALDRVNAALAASPGAPSHRAIGDYHAEADYVAAVAAAIGRSRSNWQHLVFSFHGIPQRYADAGDPYPAQCLATARLVAERLGLPESLWSVAFQSRFGRARWLEPETVARLSELPAAGTRRVAVVCPGFAVDCLETLEEIDIRGRAAFLAAGGSEFEYIPALNDDAAHVRCLARLAAEVLA